MSVSVPKSVAVIGGGVCGLGVGWRLAKAGVRVTVYERGGLREGATWVSAGMLASHLELSPEEEHITFLGRESMTRWPRFREQVEADAGMSIDYRDDGMLFVALDRDATAKLRFLHRHQEEIGLPVEWLSGDAAREREPHLSRRVVGAIYSSEDHQVDAAALGDALIRAFESQGGEIRENSPVSRVVIENGRAVGVEIGDERIDADAVLIAAGAWSALLDGLDDSQKPPVRPVKGQILTVRQPEPHLIRHCVWAMSDGEFVYMAPKSDGKLLIGATIEEMGFDKSATVGGTLQLLRPAWDALPAMDDLAIEALNVGLRPGSRDNAPILGKTPIDGLFMATGHYRNGILFSPVTTEDVATAILTGETSEAIAPYGIERFGVR